MFKLVKQTKNTAKKAMLSGIGVLNNLRVDKGGISYRVRALQSKLVPIDYLGWVGHRNFGDELLFWACRDVLFPDRFLFADGAKPLEYRIAQSLGLTSDAVRKPVLMLGGGTLVLREEFLKPLERAIEANVPIVVFGTGVADLSYTLAYERPQIEETFVDRWRSVIRSSLFVGVRGNKSIATLREIGIENAQMIGDPALACRVGENAQSFDLPHRVGVNLGSHDRILGDPKVVQSIVMRCLMRLVNMGFSIDFFSLHSYDSRIGREISKYFPANVFRFVDCNKIGWQASFRLMAQCQFVFGQRLHFVVSAAAAGVPFISLSYQPKCLDFIESIDALSEGLVTDCLNEVNLWNAIEQIIENRKEVLQRQSHGVAYLRGKLTEASQQVRGILDGCS